MVRGAIPALAGLAELIGDPQVRNRGTFGGSVANNDPAADCPAAVLALNGTIVTDRREIAADDFFQGMFATALEPGEIVVRLASRRPSARPTRSSRSRLRVMRWRACSWRWARGGMRVAVTGAGNGVFRWREAEAALDRRLVPEALADAALDSPSSAATCTPRRSTGRSSCG